MAGVRRHKKGSQLLPPAAAVVMMSAIVIVKVCATKPRRAKASPSSVGSYTTSQNPALQHSCALCHVRYADVPGTRL